MKFWNSLLFTALISASCNLYAQTIYQCAQAGGTDCKESGIRTAVPLDPVSTPDMQCRQACISLANTVMRGLNDSYGTGWACVAKSATFTHISEDSHGGMSVHCECDLQCIKGI